MTAVRDRTAGEGFVEWLRGRERQAASGGVGAFARWVVAAVDDGEVAESDTWYPKRLERKSRQFPLEDWKDAKAVYTSGGIEYCCSGDGRDEDDPGAESCWAGSRGECRGACRRGRAFYVQT